MTLTRACSFAVLVVLTGACGGGARQAPSPTAYTWPDSFSFVVEYVAESRGDTAIVSRYEERKILRFGVRDDGFVVWHDSVLKLSFAPGRPPAAEPFESEDTLHYFIELSRRGEVTHSEPGCDPALAACREALPSALPLELRRLVPSLPVWEAPRGSLWEDTLIFDDTPRRRGARGSVVTSYRVAGDTVVAGGAFWVVAWRSIRRSYIEVGGLAGLAGTPPLEERGMVFIDKERLVPAYAAWAGGAVAPPGLRAMGVTSTGFRGRARLVGSVAERLFSPE